MLPASSLDAKNISWNYFDKAFWVSSSNMHTVIELLILISMELNSILARLDAIEAEIADLWTAINNAMGNITDIWMNISDIWSALADDAADINNLYDICRNLLDLIHLYHPPTP